MPNRRHYSTHPNSPRRFSYRRGQTPSWQHQHQKQQEQQQQTLLQPLTTNRQSTNLNLQNQFTHSAWTSREVDHWRPQWRHVTYSHVTSYRGSSHILHHQNSYLYRSDVDKNQFRHIPQPQPLYQRVQSWFSSILHSRRARRNERLMAQHINQSTPHSLSSIAAMSQIQSDVEKIGNAKSHNMQHGNFTSASNDQMSVQYTWPQSQQEMQNKYFTSRFHNKKSSNVSVNASSGDSSVVNDVNYMMPSSQQDLHRLRSRASLSSSSSSSSLFSTPSRLRTPFSSSISYLSHPALLVNVAKKQLSFFSWTEALKVGFLVVIVSVGSAMQVIMLNFWLRSYPTYHGNRGNYTTFAISSCIFAMFFNLTLFMYLLVYKSSLRFVWDRRGLKLLLWLGVVDTLNSCLTIYAASHVSEMLQALSTSLIPLITVLCQKSLLHDPREYCNCTVIFSFTCTITGIFVAASYSFLHKRYSIMPNNNKYTTIIHKHASSSISENENESEWSKLCWALLYCSAVLPSVLQNILQTDYMLNFTKDALFQEWYLVSKHAIQRVSACLRGKRYSAQVQKTAKKSVENNNNNNNNNNQSIVFVLSDHHAQSSTITNTNTKYGTFDQCNKNNIIDIGSNKNGGALPSSLHNQTQIAQPHNRQAPETQSFVFTNPVAHAQIDVSYAVAQGDDLVVKLAMLAIETTLLALCTLLLLPIDTLPWFGGSSSLHEAWDNLYRQTHHLLVHPMTLLFCLLYCLGFVFTYLGAAYLDQINVTLCALVIQLASPCTALVLLLFPFLNVTGDYTPWQWSLLAIVLMSIGALAYVLWDQKTSEQKALGEFAVKAQFVQPHVRVTVPANKPLHNFDFISEV